MYMLANWLFFQILILTVLECVDALRTGFWLAGGVAKCSNYLLVAVRYMPSTAAPLHKVPPRITEKFAFPPTFINHRR
jgi:hypothetical protein